MAVEKENLTSCLCTKQGCWRGQDSDIPGYCQANNYLEEIEKSKEEYGKPENVRIYEAACVVGAEKDGFRPRVEEALHFSKELKLTKIGFATCTPLEYDMKTLERLFTQEGFRVVCAGCQIGRVSAEDRGLPHLNEYVNSACNPIAQTQILNSASTELNFIVGLCLGHDILFTQHSKAPVSTLIVKDRMTGNNPSAALYGWHARRKLFNVPRMNEEKV